MGDGISIDRVSGIHLYTDGLGWTEDLVKAIFVGSRGPNYITVF